MGRKRKQRTEEEIRRKIKKLEDQLALTTSDCGNLPPDDGFNNVPLEPLETPYVESVYCESPIPDTILYDEGTMSSRLPSPHRRSPGHESPRSISPRPVSPRPASPDPAPPQPVMPPQPGTSAEGAVNEVELDDDILQLLGDAPKPETLLGPSIHKDVARRWQDILAKGLPKEVRESLLKDYLVPSNCDLLLPPALNPEVKAALPDTLVKRDSSLLYKQKQLGIALSALAKVTELVIANETSRQKILKPLSDACRILCDSHFATTKTRRNFVISSINVKLRDALIESNRDKLLFGDNVSEKLKAAKTIQQSGEALKNAQRTKFQRSNVPSTSGNNKAHLNYVPQHRKTDNKLNDSRRSSNYVQRPLMNNNNRRPVNRSLPPPPLPPRTLAPQRR